LRIVSIDEGVGTSGEKGEKSLIEKMKASGKSIVVFFGSQTGTGEEFAQRLAKNSRLFGLKALVVDPEEIDLVKEIYLILNYFIISILKLFSCF
jgi:NADPH-ferrihemoprotein reductase